MFKCEIYWIYDHFKLSVTFEIHSNSQRTLKELVDYGLIMPAYVRESMIN